LANSLVVLHFSASKATTSLCCIIGFFATVV
jgi:hypothetical protein